MRQREIIKLYQNSYKGLRNPQQSSIKSAIRSKKVFCLQVVLHYFNTIMTKFSQRIRNRVILLKIYRESYFEPNKTTKILSSKLLFYTSDKKGFSIVISKLIMKKDLQISFELLEFMQFHQILNLTTLLGFDDEKLLKMDGFGWRLMREVLVFREGK